ncbi:MAG TPA: DUF4422 domain-containing protein [Pseudolabrys sp.]|nr:DUF4422 domain-containing protein [Pseudolabrys sp.]
MRADIYTLYHYVPDTFVANALYRPMVLGHRIGAHPALLSDESGDNISQEGSYCEMRGQYWVWKNALANSDYVGFQHYRRWLFFDQMPSASVHPIFQQIRRTYLADPHVNDLGADATGFKIYTDAAQAHDAADLDAIRDTIGRYDIITVRPWKFSVAAQYKSLHVPEDWGTLMQVLSKHSYFRNRQSFLDVDIQAFYGCNMYVMRAEEFDAYMAFWHETIQEFAHLVKPHADAYQSRIYGFLSERIFTLYLYQLRMERPNLRVLEVPKIVGPQRLA